MTCDRRAHIIVCMMYVLQIYASITCLHQLFFVCCGGTEQLFSPPPCIASFELFIGHTRKYNKTTYKNVWLTAKRRYYCQGILGSIESLLRCESYWSYLDQPLSLLFVAAEGAAPVSTFFPGFGEPKKSVSCSPPMLVVVAAGKSRHDWLWKLLLVRRTTTVARPPSPWLPRWN